MAFSSRQITLQANTATATLVQGTTGTKFKTVPSSGTVQDPIPVSIKNEDTVQVVWWGGPDVDAIHCQSIPPGGTVVMNLYGASEIPFVFSTATPIVSVAVGRQ